MGKAIRLRSLTLSDLPLTLALHQQAKYTDLYATTPFPVNQELEQKWYSNILTANYPNTVFGVELLENKDIIGVSSLNGIDLLNRSAEIVIYIDDLLENSEHYYAEAIEMTLDFGFSKLGLNRIAIDVRSDNDLLAKTCTDIGFVQECILRDAKYHKGEFRSIVVYSMLRDEYLERYHKDAD